MKRATPRLDAYLAQLKRELKPRGRRIELARFLGRGEATSTATYQNQIPRWLNGRGGLHAESLLGIEAWRAARKKGTDG